MLDLNLVLKSTRNTKIYQILLTKLELKDSETGSRLYESVFLGTKFISYFKILY